MMPSTSSMLSSSFTTSRTLSRRPADAAAGNTSIPREIYIVSLRAPAKTSSKPAPAVAASTKPTSTMLLDSDGGGAGRLLRCRWGEDNNKVKDPLRMNMDRSPGGPPCRRDTGGGGGGGGTCGGAAARVTPSSASASPPLLPRRTVDTTAFVAAPLSSTATAAGRRPTAGEQNFNVELS